MSSSKVTVLNCGASQFSLGVFSVTDNEPVLENIYTKDLSYDYSEEDYWLGAVLGALRESASEHKVSGPVQVVLPGFLLLTKTLKIARVDESKRAQMIAFEAQQNIPYQLSELSWSYQILADDGIETEILFIGIRSSICQKFCQEISKLGFTVVSVNASTILDYNAYQVTQLLDYGASQLASDEKSENVLIVNIGARASNLTFVQQEGFFVRNISLGGNALTQNIADNLGRGFADAEQVKVAYFSDNGQGHSSAEMMESASNTFMRRMSQEITRSIVNFRQQRKGAAPQKILLAGRGSLLPGLADFLKNSQRLEVDFFRPGNNIQISEGSGLAPDSMEIFQSSELIGEVSKGLVPNGVGVDLLPEDLRKAISFRKKGPWILAAAALVAISPFPLWFTAKEEAGLYEEAKAAVQHQLPPIQQNYDRIQGLLNEIEEAYGRVERFDGLVRSRSNWISFFSALQESLYNIRDVWLDELEVNRIQARDQVQYQLRVKGRLLLRQQGLDILATTTELDEVLLSNRIRALSDSFTASPFIRERISFSIDFQAVQAGRPMMPFELLFSIEPDRPL